jgi:hypothetical protein
LEPPTPVRIDVQHLSRTFRGIARALQDTLHAPIFFIALHPHLWADEYYGVLGSSAENENRRAQWLMGRIDKLSSTRADDWVALDSIAEELVSEIGKSDPHEILSGAFNVLSRQPVRMGSRRLDGSAGRPGARQESAFFLRGGGTPAPGWFQDALDFGGNWELKIEDFRQFLGTSRDNRFCKFRWPFGTDRARLMEVQTYVKREGLMSGRLAIFIAEYLYYLAGMQLLGHGENRHPNPSELDHFFLPLRGLGQWRASACWLRFNPVTRNTQLPEFPGAALPTALEELTTKSILESFRVRLEQAIATRRRLFVPDQASFIEVDNPLADLAYAFSTLWWSEEILLLERDKCVFRLARDGGGDLVPQECTEPLGNLINRKKRLIQWEQTKDATLVQVNLEELRDRGPALRNTHGVSKVQFRVRLLTAPERDIRWRETWNDYEAQLQDVLQRVLGVTDR